MVADSTNNDIRWTAASWFLVYLVLPSLLPIRFCNLPWMNWRYSAFVLLRGYDDIEYGSDRLWFVCILVGAISAVEVVVVAALNDEDGDNNDVDDDPEVYCAGAFPAAQEDCVIPSQNVNDNKIVVNKDEIFGMSDIILVYSAAWDVIFLSRWIILCWIANRWWWWLQGVEVVRLWQDDDRFISIERWALLLMLLVSKHDAWLTWRINDADDDGDDGRCCRHRWRPRCVGGDAGSRLLTNPTENDALSPWW